MELKVTEQRDERAPGVDHQNQVSRILDLGFEDIDRTVADIEAEQ